MFPDDQKKLIDVPAEGQKEFEIKFALKQGDISRLFTKKYLDSKAFGRAQAIQTIYYDTPDAALFRAGITLRWRKQGSRKPVLTFKLASSGGAALFERTEIEVPAGPRGVDIDLFGDAVASQIRQTIAGGDIVPRCETNFKRQIALVETPVSSFEIALDTGQFLAGERAWPLNELEIELKRGDWAEMLDLAKELAGQAGLCLETVSKAERCLILAGLRPNARKAAPSLVREGMSLDAVMIFILSEGLRHFTDHLQSFRDDAAPRAVHQMRVGLRRLRAALKIFGRTFPQASFSHYAARARDLANGLALARECDAFRELAFGHPLAHPDAPDDAKNLDASLARLRGKAYADAAAIIDSAATTLFILELQSYIAKRGWRSEIADDQLLRLTQPAAPFAEATLNRLFKKAKSRGEALLEKSDEERHEFRIALKNLRYNAQFFVTLFDHAKLYKAWNAAMVQLQNSLGVHNDLAGAQAMLNRLKADGGDNFAAAAGFVLGWYACQGEAADANIVKQWKQVRKLPRFWT